MDSDTNPLLEPNLHLYKLSRSARKLLPVDEFRLVNSLPKDVPERIWLEVLAKEDTDQMIFEIIDALIEDVIKVVYDEYMERQTLSFTVHCACEAWLKLIDWEFYRHDPGEDASAYPPCYIPKREESWVPDEIPTPSPKDAMCKQNLEIGELICDENLRSWPSNDSLDLPVIEEIPKKLRFPGKVLLPGYADSISETSSPIVGTSSEMVQKVTNYSSSSVPTTEESEPRPSSSSLFCFEEKLKSPTPAPTVSGGGGGDGDATSPRQPELLLRKTSRSRYQRRSLVSESMKSKSRSVKFPGRLLPPMNRESPLSIISDCRLRNLRLDTNFEIKSESFESEVKAVVKRKQ